MVTTWPTAVQSWLSAFKAAFAPKEKTVESISTAVNREINEITTGLSLFIHLSSLEILIGKESRI
jgi:hypothetical protein